MNKRIIFIRSDGGVSVVIPAPGDRRVFAVRNIQPGKEDRIEIPAPGVPVERFAKLVSEGRVVIEKQETEVEWLDRVTARSVPTDATDVHIVDVADLPQDRTYRDAWAITRGRCAVDMPKARVLHCERLRSARKPLLEALDVEYQRADEAGDDGGKKRIAARKQTLRDVTADPAIETAQTPAALAALWPAVLPKD
jgi:hypothetical protein